ncbi:MAG: hypothetical protein CFE28_07115 [Alphaproteobacteria bacterium PA2]|nr:MAG: hypothetical protein CFE28_07115 [Alphaproteobacteria bacterium PA2]
MKFALMLTAVVLAIATPALAQPQKISPEWRVYVSASQSKLNKGRGKWQDAALVAAYRQNASTWLSGGIETSRRFGMQDTVISGRIARTFDKGATAQVALAGAPGAKIRAQTAIQVGATTAPIVHFSPEWSLNLGLQATAAHYKSNDVGSFQPFVEVKSDKGAEFSARAIASFGDFGKTLYGYSLRGLTPVTNRMRVQVGYADAPESDSGITLKTQAYSGGLAFDINDWTSVRLDAAHEVRDQFDRNELAVGLARRF